MVEQPQDFGGEISHLVVVIAVDRGLPGAKSAFLQIELNDRLTQSHVFHNFDHGRDIVHLTGFVWIDANIGSRENVQ